MKWGPLIFYAKITTLFSPIMLSLQNNKMRPLSREISLCCRFSFGPNTTRCGMKIVLTKWGPPIREPTFLNTRNQHKCRLLSRLSFSGRIDQSILVKGCLDIDESGLSVSRLLKL